MAACIEVDQSTLDKIRIRTFLLVLLASHIAVSAVKYLVAISAVTV